MAFNPLMIRLTAELVPILPRFATVAELGNQTFRPNREILSEITTFLKRELPSWNEGELTALAERTGAALEGSSADYMKSIGYGNYTCIDVNDRYGALQMDLNYSLADKYGFHDEFDLVTNNGTGEHIFDQAAVFRNIHALTRTGGVMMHVLPFHNYINHGFYNVQPLLFHDLAEANQYKILRMSLANRDAKEIAFAEEKVNATRALTTYPLDAIVDRTVAMPGLKDLKLRTVRRSMRPIAKAMRSMAVSRNNILLVAVLQKTRSDAFRHPMQGMYAGANISSGRIATEYVQASAAGASVAG